MLAVLFLNRISLKRRQLALEKRAAAAKKLQQDAESKYCRTCLATEGLSPIFSKETEAKRTQDLNNVTGLEIKMYDGLSQKICAQCVDAINACLKFRKACRKAEKTLRGLAVKVKKKHKLLKEVARNKDSEPIKTEVEVEVVSVEADFCYDNFDADFQDCDYPDTETQPVQKKGAVARKKRPARTRLGPASFECGTCHKEFRMKATYKAHMRFHTNFCVCEACGKRCRNNNQLQEHKRARHGLGRIHKCAYCEYSSATKEALIIHERRHTGERPYVCDHCGATFHRRSNLVQHIAIHSTLNNWQCDMCPKRLKSKKFLQIHKHNAHTGKRYGYLCGVCSHRFEKPNKVRAHARRVHGLPDDQQAPITRVQL